MVHQTKVISTSLVEQWQLEIQLQNDRVAIKGADAAFRLATLATVFLPLSFASSLLAMTARFKHLRLLLYDFLGVSVLLLTAALLAWTIIRVANNPYGLTRTLVYSLRRRLGYNWIPSLPGSPSDTAMLFRAFMLACLWTSLVASFLLGMLKEVSLALKVLGYAAVAIVSLSLFIPLSCKIYYVYYPPK